MSHLRYQIVGPDKKPTYGTESLTDARRQWKLMIGHGATLNDVLHVAGLVSQPGSTKEIAEAANKATDAYWQSIKESFPGITLPPRGTGGSRNLSATALERWLVQNLDVKR